MWWRRKATETIEQRHCRTCRYFESDPQQLEKLIPGLISLSSAHASVRADDGLCMRHLRYAAANGGCGEWRARSRDKIQIL